MTDRKKAKLLGELVQKARTHARRTVEECAAVLNLDPETFSQAEAGEHDLSLPDLEALAIFLDVPMGYFWGTASLPAEPEVDYEGWITLRQRVIGVLLRQMRIQARKSPEELAAHLGIDAARIQAYEAGDEPVPYLHLEALCQYLDANTMDFMDDQRGPLGRHEARHKLDKIFAGMTPDMQQFMVNPVNRSYLETARRISEMDVERLRQVAENILEITY